MSRSRKHTPITGNTTARSEKEFKRSTNRALRRSEHMRTHAALVTDDDPEYLAPKEKGDPWGGPKDGKHYFSPKMAEDAAARWGTLVPEPHEFWVK